jgi:enoyl-CoA hydratase/carnithine racemase
VRAVVITGKGRGFCSGGDVEDIIGALFGRDAAGLRQFTKMTCDLVLAIRRCRRPVIAALNGTVAGAGAVIAAACDFRIAAESARIAFLFVRVGLSGADMGASVAAAAHRGPRSRDRAAHAGRLRRRQARARDRSLPPRRAGQPGARRRDRRSPSGSPAAPPTRSASRSARSTSRPAYDLERALAHEADVQAGLMEHPNYREAYEAFRAKREPKFQ